MFYKMAIFALASLALVLAAPATAQDCGLKEYASLKIETLPSGEITVPIEVNGVQKKLEISFGHFYSALYQNAVAQLGLPTGDFHHGQRFYFGGVSSPGLVAPNLHVGSAVLDKFDMVTVPEDPKDGTDGFLGMDFFRHFEVELDFRNAKLNLFSPDHCPGKVVYWTDSGVTVIPFGYNRMGQIYVVAGLDGRRVFASLTTAPSNALMALELAAQIFDISLKTPELRPVGSDDGGLYYSYPFKSLLIGDVDISNPSIELRPSMNECDGWHSGMRKNLGECWGYESLLLGLHELRPLHLFVSFKDAKLYVTAADAHK